jgi:hypothetical protein
MGSGTATSSSPTIAALKMTETRRPGTHWWAALWLLALLVVL